ncbi:ATP-binding protein [Massilia sp. HP4]|uniref:ATP-binding protein n=1 Tax=Massilia sp. HP4 TaxID=2562316 RepID=UPI0010BFFC23|nr:ATP-binding protein [Massilia sp. HP4]
MLRRLANRPSSLFQRLMFSFTGVIIGVAIIGLVWVFLEAKATQRSRTFSENKAHTANILAHLSDVGPNVARMLPVLEEIEANRVRMFQELDYHSHVRVRVWLHGRLVYNSAPELPERLPEVATREAYAWVRWEARDALQGIVVERRHEVDDEWMFSIGGVGFLLSSTIFSLPLLLIPAWLIVGIGLRPLRTIASHIAQRSDADLTPLPDSTYRELSPLVDAINGLMARLSQRIEHEHEFLTDAAHELKTPLAAIQINAHVLMSRAGNEVAERCAEPAAGLRSGVARATHTVHQLLALERARAEPQVDHPRPLTDVAEFVRDRVAAAAHLAVARNIEIEFHADGEGSLPLHLESMASAVDNLISNAIKYSPQDGRIAVRLTRIGHIFCLAIADQGPGIAPELRDKVFDRFYRVPGQEQSGSGLGLAIAERGAARNGGIIVLSDGEGGRGLTATIEFAGAAA